MRTFTLRTAAGRALATLGVLAVLGSAPASRALAEDAPGAPAAPAPTAAEDRIFEARLDAGYRVVDVEDDRSLLFPYDPLADGPILGLDLLYLTPGFGALKLEAGYVDGDSWQASADYNHGSDFAVRAGSSAFTHERQHAAPVPSTFGAIEVEAEDEDPGRDYRDERRESSAALKVRAPGFPAHLRVSGRIARHEGVQQMPVFFRSCSTHFCHVNSRSRELDQVTREYTVGVDTHAGPIDLAYSHTAQTFRDDAPDPTQVMATTYSGFVPPGTYPHDVNPDLRSYSDTLKLNTNLTNRMVLSAAYSGGEQENEAKDITRSFRTAGASLSWRMAPAVLLVGRYAYDEERTEDLGAQARELRTKNNAAHVLSKFTHQHAVEPERTRHTGEVAATFTPLRGLDIGARLRYRTLERVGVSKPEGEAFDDGTSTTDTTLAALDLRYRVGKAVALDGTVGREWTDGPVYAVETTGVARYGLGATWTPGPVFFARAAWQGFRGENDDAGALRHAYAETPEGTPAPERSVSGDAFSLAASYVPVPAFSLTASWSLTESGVEQDLIFGSAGTPGYWFLSSDTPWDGRAQLADLKARWEVTKRVALTAEGLWLDSLESYEPTFPQGNGLEEISRVEFTKLLGSLQAAVRVTDAMGVTVSGFWARYDDQADDAGDGTVQGLLAALNVRW